MKKAGLLTSGLVTVPSFASAQSFPEKTDEGLYLLGPQKGYSLMVGTLLSSMTMMRKWVIDTVKDLNVDQLDFLFDEKSNSIGAMLLHLAATERYYQLNTFDNITWGKWDTKIKEEWDTASNLGVEARTEIKGNDVNFYLEKLAEVRATTMKEFAKRDDTWLMKSEPFFGNMPTNNHAKWFHVCEHESNHRGQMKFIISRLPA